MIVVEVSDPTYAAPAERLSTVSSPFLSAAFVYVVESNIFLAENLIMNCNF